MGIAKYNISKFNDQRDEALVWKTLKEYYDRGGENIHLELNNWSKFWASS